MMSRDFERSRREIDSGNQCAATRELQKVRAHAAAHFEQTLPGKLIEAHHLGHPGRVLLVAMTFDFVEKFARAKFVPAAVNSTSWIFAPLLAGALLVVSHEVSRAYSSITRCTFRFQVCRSTASRRAAEPSCSRKSRDSRRRNIASVNCRTLPGSTSNAVSSSFKTSPIWPRRLATIAFPIAMYSKSFVGEPKNALPSASGTCGEI